MYIAKPPLYRLTRGPEAPLHRARVRARGHPARRQVREARGLRPLQQAVQADRRAVEAVQPAAQAVRGVGLGAARGARSRRGRRSCSRRGCSRSRSPTSTRCCATSPRTARTARRYRARAALRGRARGRDPHDRGQDRPGHHASRPRAPRSTPSEYRRLADVHKELVGAGRHAAVPRPARARTASDAATFEELREAVLAIAQKGIEYYRFKGLGEMDADELRETTMDPEPRARWCRSRWRTRRRPTWCSRC